MKKQNQYLHRPWLVIDAESIGLLADARQSARLLKQAIESLKK